MTCCCCCVFVCVCVCVCVCVRARGGGGVRAGRGGGGGGGLSLFLNARRRNQHTTRTHTRANSPSSTHTKRHQLPPLLPHTIHTNYTDTIRTIEGYADCIVLRHFQEGSAKRAAGAASVPVLNAGDGPGQHPSQALLDVYSIKKEIGRLDNVSIAMVGDLLNGRTVRSLAYLLSMYPGVKVCVGVCVGVCVCVCGCRV